MTNANCAPGASALVSLAFPLMAPANAKPIQSQTITKHQTKKERLIIMKHEAITALVNSRLQDLEDHKDGQAEASELTGSIATLDKQTQWNKTAAKQKGNQ